MISTMVFVCWTSVSPWDSTSLPWHRVSPPSRSFGSFVILSVVFVVLLYWFGTRPGSFSIRPARFETLVRFAPFVVSFSNVDCYVMRSIQLGMSPSLCVLVSIRYLCFPQVLQSVVGCVVPGNVSPAPSSIPLRAWQN